MSDWLLIAGDFTPLGGMDRANHALAMHLARRAHRLRQPRRAPRRGPTWRSSPAVRFTRCGGRSARTSSARRCSPRQASARPRRLRPVHVIANGGNADAGRCDLGALPPRGARAAGRRHPPPVCMHASAHAYYVRARADRAAARARSSSATASAPRRTCTSGSGSTPARTRVVYYGSDAAQFSARVRGGARGRQARSSGGRLDRPVALFVGALGDRRKGFDRLFDAWALSAATPAWDADLAVAGHGRGAAGLAAPRRRPRDLAAAITFLGFRTDVSRVIGAADVMVHPARYEAYGLGVHEAICRGVPAIVSARAGIAELYPPALRGSPDRGCRRRTPALPTGCSAGERTRDRRPNASVPCPSVCAARSWTRHGRGDRAGGDRVIGEPAFAAFDALHVCVCGGAALTAGPRAHRSSCRCTRRRIRSWRRTRADARASMRCAACGFAQPAALPALPRFFDRLYDQRWSDDWIRDGVRGRLQGRDLPRDPRRAGAAAAIRRAAGCSTSARTRAASSRSRGQRAGRPKASS